MLQTGKNFFSDRKDGSGMRNLRTGKENKPSWETSRVSFVRHAEGDHDLLFIGTDTKECKFTVRNHAGMK